MKKTFVLTLLIAGLLVSAARAQETQPIIPVPPPAASTSAPAPPAAANFPVQTAAPSGTSQSSSSTSRAISGLSTAPVIPVAGTSDYVIGPRDALSISVWKEPNVSGSVEVRPDGMISLPLVGDVKADGLTPTGLATGLAGQLKKFINDPLVTVTVTGINSKHLYLAGNIGHPGELPYSPDMTPMQVIISAGGVSPLGKKTKIYILRTVAGKQVRIPFDYKKALKTGDQQGVVLLPNDTIVVP